MSNRIKILVVMVTVILLAVTFAVFRVSSDDQVSESVVPSVVEVPAESASIVQQENIGTSVQGRAIEVVSFGSGDIHLLFVGGIHGGYEWNSVVLAQEMIAYFTQNPDAVPKYVTLSIIPSLNPDAIFKITGKEGTTSAGDILPGVDQATARFNANNVDLNRNFACKWQPKSTWRSHEVSAGTEAFSEPEAVALRDYALKYTPKAVILWHSQASNVYASQCENGVLPETLTIMNVYAKAAGYGAVAEFDAYAVTGAAEDWLASINIPALTVELTNHTDTEFQKNLRGVEALLHHFAQ